MKKLLFISHNATVSGAPILLRNLLFLLRNQGHQVDVVIKEDGPLTGLFAKLAPTTVLARQRAGLREKLKRVSTKLALRLRLRSYDLVLSNTISNGNLHALLRRHRRVLTYVHELANVIENITTARQVESVLRHTKLFLVPGEAVRNLLIQQFGVAPDRIFRLPYFIPDKFAQKAALRTAFRKVYSLADSFVVCGMGWVSERKGIDLFLEVARITVAEDAAVRFIWCGGKMGSAEWRSCEAFIQTHALQQNLLLIAENDRPEEVMAGSDAFFLSSREDPYPQVMLEAAMMELPMVYFAGTGGADEFGPEANALAAPALDTAAASSQLLRLRRDEGLRRRSGETARRKYLQEHTATPVLGAFETICEAMEEEQSNSKRSSKPLAT